MYSYDPLFFEKKSGSDNCTVAKTPEQRRSISRFRKLVCGSPISSRESFRPAIQNIGKIREYYICDYPVVTSQPAVALRMGGLVTTL